MSWIIGISGPGSLRNSVKNIHPSPLFKTESHNLYIATGGNPTTCFHYADEKNNGWIAVGIGIKSNSNQYSLMNFNDWKEYASNRDKHNTSIDGHYVLLKWDEENISIETDRLGLRDIYTGTLENSNIFSTRLDWIGKLLNADFDIDNLGSAWLLTGQLTNESLLKNIKRITKCKQCTFNHNKFELKYWESIFENNNNSTVELFDQKLESIIEGLYKNSEAFELSLSGGMDSRLLLSYLLKMKIKNFETHTFGNPLHPDNQLAKDISRGLNFGHRNIYEPLESKEKIINDAEDFIIRRRVSCPLTEFLNLRFYNLINPGTIIIDGGYGELWRNEFFYRLRTTESKIIKEKNDSEMFRFLSFNRADIFCDDVKRKMISAGRQQIQKLFSEMPGYTEIGLDNWLDILIVNIKLPNYVSPEQSRIDDYAISIMPFIQPSILQMLFSVDIEYRNNGKLIRDIIHRNCPSLEEFNLVKGDVVRSYKSGSLKSRAVSRLKSKLGFAYKEKDKIKLLQHFRDYANDLVQSQSVKSYPLYDYKKVKSLVDNFYDGNIALSSELDWWLSFEIFRKSFTS